MDFTASPDRPAVASVIAGGAPAISMSYQEDGSRLFVASESDSTLRIIDCMTGKQSEAPLRCDRERIHFVTATHHPNCVLFAGKGSPSQPLGQRNAVNYWSTYDNKLLRKFRGHTDTVVSISVSPADDKFLTSSKDRTVRLYSLQEAGSVAQLQLPSSATGTPQAVFDSTGLVFAVSAAVAGGKGQYVHLYDARQFDSGAFAELTVSPEGLGQAITSQIGAAGVEYSATAPWTSLQFNASGNQMLAGTSEGLAVVLDGFEATVQRVVAPTMKSSSSAGAVCCFTPDDKTVLLGNPDGSISCFSVETGAVVKSLTGHTGPISAMATNPKYAQFASACSSTALWSW